MSIDVTPWLHLGRPKEVEELTFTVEVATSAEQLAAAVAVRSRAYAYHGAPGAASLGAPEADDLRGDVVVLLARQKVSGRCIGSIRIQPNFGRALRFEESVVLPDHLQGRRAIELMRLGVERGQHGLMVTKSLSRVLHR